MIFIEEKEKHKTQEFF